MEALRKIDLPILEEVVGAQTTQETFEQPETGQDLPNIIKALRTVREIPIQISSGFPTKILEMIQAAKDAYNAIDEQLAQILEHIVAEELPKTEPLELNEAEIRKFLETCSIEQLETIREDLNITANNLNTGYEHPLKVVATTPERVETLIAKAKRAQRVIICQLVEMLRTYSEIITGIVVAKKRALFAEEITRIGDEQFAITARRGVRFERPQDRARAAVIAGIGASFPHVNGTSYLGSPTYPAEIRTTTKGEIQSKVIKKGIERVRRALRIPTPDLATFGNLPGGFLRERRMGDRRENLEIKLGIAGL